MIDTHVHLTDEAFAEDLSEVIKRATEAGIEKMIVIAFDLPSSYAVVNLAKKYTQLYCAVGIHPCDASSWNAETKRQLESLLQNKQENKIVAVGEIGLDYHYDNVPRPPQYQCFFDQIKLSYKYNLPFIVHDRDAHEDCFKVVQDAYNQGFLLDKPGVFHCYSSSPEMAKRLLELGFYFGFDGPLTYKNAKQPVLSCKSIPQDRLLLETDCPYLPPVPYRGKRNEPSYLLYIAEKMAEIRGDNLASVQEYTTKNAKDLFFSRI